MADDPGEGSRTPSGVELLNAALDGLCDVLVGLECLSGDADFIFQYGERWDYLFDLDGDFYGLGWRLHNVSDATQKPRALWVSDWQSEVMTWLRSEGVDTQGLSSDKLVAAASKKYGGLEFLLRPDSSSDHVAKAVCCAETLKFIPRHVDCLQRGQAKVDKAVQAFPSAVLTALDGLGPGSWRTRLRRDVLNVAVRWPGTKGQGMKACYVMGNPKKFIELVGKHDPRKTWAQYVDLVEDARADILAAEGEVALEASTTKSKGTFADSSFTNGLAETKSPSDLGLGDLLGEWFQLYGSLFFYTMHAEGVDNALIGRRQAGVLRFKLVTEELARRGERLGIDATGLFRMAGTLHSVDDHGRVLDIPDQLKDDVHALAKRIEIRIGPPGPSESTESVARVQDGSALLGGSLQRLRSRFEDGFRRQQKLTGVMVHHTSPTQGPQPDWPDAFVEGLQPLRGYRGLESKHKQLRSREDYALVANRPFLDIDGQPISTSAGEPIPMIPEWSRRISLYGQSGPKKEWLHQSVEAFDACCREAGSLIHSLDQRLKTVIWRDWTPPFLLPDDAGLWLSAVFELAYQNHDGAGLDTDRSGWLGYQSAPIQTIAKFLDGSARTSPIEELANAVGDPPGYWFSKLENIWQASVAAIDLLISLAQPHIDQPHPGPTESSEKDKELSLSHSKIEVIQYLIAVKAFDDSTRRTAREIAKGVAGPSAGPGGFKQPLKQLVCDGLLMSKTGRGGGYWLTESGIKRGGRKPL